MDSIRNPFSPNAGRRPPALVGRDDILEEARVLMGRTQLRKSVQSLLITGLRGVGKTVILNEILRKAEESGTIIPIYVEASENRGLAELLAAPLKLELLKLNRLDGAMVAARHGLSILRNFLGTVRISFGDVGIELEPAPGEGDSGDMQYDLCTLLSAVAVAAGKKDKAIVLLIDEVQYLSQEELEALVMSIHHMQQRELPLALIGAGLPILARLAGEAKSYAERLFRYPVVGPLSEENAKQAIAEPLRQEGIRIADDALAAIWHESGGYPFFLQEWGSQLWNYIEREPISLDDVKGVRSIVLSSLDVNFFRIRMERVTASEKKFIYAMSSRMAEDGNCRVSDVADALAVDLSSLGPRRLSLIKKGVVYSPGHGLLSFTVPMFSEFLKRNQTL